MKNKAPLVHKESAGEIYEDDRMVPGYIAESRTSAPRHYYPVNNYNTPPTTTPPPHNKVTSSQIRDFTKKAYMFQSGINQLIKEQENTIIDKATPPPSYLIDDNLWEGYSKVLADLLKHRRHTTTRPGVSKTDMDSDNERLDTNKYIGDPIRVSANTIIVGPHITPSTEVDLEILEDNVEEQESVLYPRYRINQVPTTPRNWTSIELAKPRWEEEPGRVRKGGWSLEQRGSVSEKKPYGDWDNSINIRPART